MFGMTDLFPFFEWISVVYFLLPIASSIAPPSRLYGRKCLQSYYTPPKCIDHPAGYGCDCGPGFHWNTVMCMSTAVDSRLEFKRQEPVRYTLLLSKAFPSLSQFTVVFWVKVMDSSINGTILSYKHKSNLDLLLMRSGPTLWFEIFGEGFDTGFKFRRNTWYHVAWTWEAHDGNWTLHVNGGFYNGTNGQQKSVPSGGEFVLGQSSMREFDFDTQYAFVGDIAHLHIWSFVLTSEEINAVQNGCTLMYCGDAVQWTELRSGTRGSMRMRWPSGTVKQQCFTEEKVAITCNKYCSDLIGAQCNQQTVENIEWSRTPAVKNISISVCPGTIKDKSGHLMGNKTVSEIATRPCYVTAENEGEWGKPEINNCISEPLRKLKYKFQKSLFATVVNESTILDLSRELCNHTDKNAYTNPIDVAAVIDLLEMIVNTQAEVIMLEVVEWSDGRQNYARAQEVFPTLEETKEFMEIVADIVNNLLNQKNREGWQATQPAGTEADNLLQVIKTFARVLGRSLNYQVTDGSVKGTFGFEQAYFKLARNRIEFSLEVQWVEDFQGTYFPNKVDTAQYSIQPRYGSIEISDRLLELTNSSNTAFVKISSLRFRGMAGILPNHDPKSTGMEAKEDNVNTPIIAMFIFPVDDLDLSRNLSSLITYTLPYSDTFNISNPECVRLVHGKINGTRIKMWQWTREGCQLMRDMGKSGTCTCSSPGIFAITTDMYNDNWNKGEVHPLLMNFASYTGCASSAVLCLLTYLLHIYFRTSSNTAFLHKNMSVSIVFSQIVFMVGIDRYENTLVCHVFAVMLHYFFLTTFSWLMNEAFNLYTVITYSVHSHGGLSESGSSLRYHIIGWVIPGVLVGAFVGSQRESYYNPAMCWVSWDNIWLCIGPAAGILLVTIMVLIFTAKEHNENSYTKSEKTNKFILNIMKALWTQVILITVFWSFAFVSLKMTDRIIKYLFGLFGFLQGVFFIVFYFLLHEEIRGIMKGMQKKQSLVIQGYNDQEDRTTDSVSASCHLIEKEPVEVVTLETKARRRREFRGKKKPRRQKSEVETILGEREEEEMTSDCEMITSL
ncbi:hypothetical protein CHS0354_034536 [Potamilus streckersoni]|uniref:Uncharacterized protein n=1 Tax=Potamilus streckersoni TaxID=2493646 RepID=A0AAE0SFH0_9BIVA|nr:hypothetical protein CHS0354_034536 [Potamilus streckersoni]